MLFPIPEQEIPSKSGDCKGVKHHKNLVDLIGVATNALFLTALFVAGPSSIIIHDHE